MELTTGSASAGAATTGTGSTGATTGGKASGVDGSTGTQSGAKPSGGTAAATTAQSNGSIDMTSARTHLDAARTALAAGNESDCMRAADEAAKAAGLAQ